jgi:hypothetical protein
MQRLVIVLLLAALSWYGYTKYQGHLARQRAAVAEAEPSRQLDRAKTEGLTTFKCDGRTYCSQMTSCAEATFFLKNCPGTKMDGNHDGVPCEQQWCK